MPRDGERVATVGAEEKHGGEGGGWSVGDGLELNSKMRINVL